MLTNMVGNMSDGLNILSRCAGQLFRITRAEACIAYTVIDNVVSFTCDLNNQVENLMEDAPQGLKDEITALQRQLQHAEFTSREDTVVYPNQENAFGFALNGRFIKNLLIVPVSDPLTVFALIIVVNGAVEKYSSNRVSVKPFITATANLFSLRQIRSFLPPKKDNIHLEKSGQGFINKLLSNVYHPVIFFNPDYSISKFNRQSMLLVQQSNITETATIRDVVDYFVPSISNKLIAQLDNYAFLGELVMSEWDNVPLKLNSFQSIQVDIKLVPILNDRRVGHSNNKDHLQFALMINDNKRNELSSLQRFQALTSLIPLGILQLDTEFKCVYANDTWSKITSLTMTTSLADGWTKSFESKCLHRMMPEMQTLNKQNREYCEEVKVITNLNTPKWVNLKSIGLFSELGTLDGYIVTIDDISHVHAQKEALENLANTDSLTGISNRNCFHDRLKLAISRVDRHDDAAILFIDLDKFKAINDTYGHNAGDAVIQKVAQRLRKIIRDEDTIARLGGDEFAVIMSDVKSDIDVVNLAIKVIIEISKPMFIEKNNLKVQCSIGISHIKHSQTTIKTVLKHADLAVYKAKSLGRNQYCVYTESLERETLLANYLRSSLQSSAASGFFMHYQPQVNASTNRIVGIEVLARWNHPKNFSVSPQEFIQQLETHGLINDFFVWQLQSLLPLAKRWMDDGLITQHRRLSINLSAVQLHLPNFAKQLLKTFTKHNVDCNCLSLEVTETAFMEDPISAGENLKVLRTAGLTIALDDFGTGFSSLSLLRNMPLDSIKIDKEFISDIINNTTDAKIVQSMITLSRELDLEVIAEGVENEEVCRWLDKNHCPIQQGFHYYKPMDHGQLETCLVAENALH